MEDIVEVNDDKPLSVDEVGIYFVVFTIYTIFHIQGHMKNKN